MTDQFFFTPLSEIIMVRHWFFEVMFPKIFPMTVPMIFPDVPLKNHQLQPVSRPQANLMRPMKVPSLKTLGFVMIITW